MVAPAERNMKKKFVKVTKGTKEVRFRDGSKGAFCGICNTKLLGVPRDVKKLSKTEKRPSVLFGGLLCSKCRDEVFDYAIMVKLKILPESEVSFKIKKYVDQAILKIA